jgi:hypothetical protein
VLHILKHLLVKAAEMHLTLMGCPVILNTNVNTLSIFGWMGAFLAPLHQGKGQYWYSLATPDKYVILSP